MSNIHVENGIADKAWLVMGTILPSKLCRPAPNGLSALEPPNLPSPAFTSSRVGDVLVSEYAV